MSTMQDLRDAGHLASCLAVLPAVCGQNPQEFAFGHEFQRCRSLASRATSVSFLVFSLVQPTVWRCWGPSVIIFLGLAVPVVLEAGMRKLEAPERATSSDKMCEFLFMLYRSDALPNAEHNAEDVAANPGNDAEARWRLRQSFF